MMINPSSTLFGAFIATTVALALVAGPAAATETKTYMGASCVASDSGTASSISNNNGETAMTGNAGVVCPIVKSVTDKSALENLTMNVTVGPSGSLTCDLYAYYAVVSLPANTNGHDYTNIAAHMSKTVTGTGAKTLSFGTAASPFAGGLPAPWASNFLYYQVSCYLHSGDHIKSYQVQEAGSRNEYAKIYPPSMCRPDPSASSCGYSYRDGTSADVGGSDIFPGGWSQSDQIMSNDVWDMLCPVIADHMGNTTGTAVASIAVGRSIGPTTPYTCTLYTSSDFGAPIDSTSQTAGFGEFPTITMNLDIAKSVAWARYHINCSSSGSGDQKILGYRVSEN